MSPVVLDLTKPAPHARTTALDVRSLVPWCVGLLRDRGVPFLFQPETARHLRHEAWRSMHAPTVGARSHSGLRRGDHPGHPAGRPPHRGAVPHAPRLTGAPLVSVCDAQLRLAGVHLAYLQAKAASGVGDDHDLLHTTLASLEAQPFDTAPDAPHVVVINPDAWGAVGRRIAELIALHDRVNETA